MASNGWKGKHHSAATKAKISASLKARSGGGTKTKRVRISQARVATTHTNKLLNAGRVGKGNTFLTKTHAIGWNKSVLPGKAGKKAAARAFLDGFGRVRGRQYSQSAIDRVRARAGS